MASNHNIPRLHPNPNDYDRGLVYDKVPEILTSGHQKRAAKIEERAAHAKYLILPTAYPFTKLVRVYSVVFSFISKCRKGREVLSRLLAEGRVVFRMFNVNLEVDDDREELFSLPIHNTGSDVVGQDGILDLTEDEPAMGLASIAMVVTLEHIEVESVSFAQVPRW